MKTGDLAYIDEQNLVYICDRGTSILETRLADSQLRLAILVKDMIIRGGENIVSAPFYQISRNLVADDGLDSIA